MTLNELEQALITAPFDSELRQHYALRLEQGQQLEQALQQYKLLNQQHADEPTYFENIERLEGVLNEDLGVNSEVDTSLIKENAEAEENNIKERFLHVVDSSVFLKASNENVVNLAHPDKIRFADIAGMGDIKKIMRRRIIDPFVNPSLFQRFKRKAGGGVLLYGPPGCGKTMMARAIATECKATFFNIGISDILNMFIGESEGNLAQIFEQARNSTPAVLFFDELDALAFSRSKARSDASRTLVNEFLSQLDGLSGTNEQLLILGATNMPWDVDEAMKRPGRFDRQVFVPPPDEQAIAEMLTTKLRDVPCGDINVNKIAKCCQKLSGADIDGLIEMAKDQVIDHIMETGNERLLQEQDFFDIVDEVSPSAIEWLQTAKNLIKYANASGAYKDVAKYLKSQGMY